MLSAVTAGSLADFLSALPKSRQQPMRLALFFLVNVFVVLLIGLSTFMQGDSFGSFVLHAVIALVAMQFVYVVWLVVVAIWPHDGSKTAEDPGTRDRENKPGRGLDAKATDQKGGPVS